MSWTASDQDYERRFQAALKELESVGVSGWQALPWTTSLLRFFRFKVRPPFYSSNKARFLGIFFFFSISWGIFMWLFVWSAQSFPLVGAIVASVISGLLFAVIAVALNSHEKGKYNLRRWEDF